jgi:uncharacterized membrane protein YfcA
MLEFGVHPKVSSSTSMYLVMLSTFAASMQYLAMGILPIDYAIALGVICSIFILLGNFAVNSIVKKIGKPSVVALFLAWIIILCTVIVLTTSVVQAYNQIQAGKDVFAVKAY